MRTTHQLLYPILTMSAICCALIRNIHADTKLVYEKEGAIWMVNSVGEKPQKVVKGVCPAIRPDGKAVAYLSGRKSGTDASVPVSLHILDLKTGRDDAIRTDTFVQGPVWSPDGTHLAFIRYQEAGLPNSFCIVDGDGLNLKTVAFKDKTAPGSIWSLEWLPDESGLGFHDMNFYWQVSMDGKVFAKQPITKFAGRKNPDGRARESLSSADTISVCPTNKTLLAFTEDVSGSPVFTEAFQGDPISALLLAESGTEPAPRLLTDKTITVTDVTWAPNGKTLYFTGYWDKNAREKSPFRIFKIGSDGQELREIDHGQNPSVASDKDPSP